MTTQSRHPHRLLPLFDPLLSRASFVVEPHHRPARRIQVGHNEPDARKQFAKVELYLRHHSSGQLVKSHVMKVPPILPGQLGRLRLVRTSPTPMIYVTGSLAIHKSQ